ncbi:tRNA threonylcarbamoyladenosine biosynthesis protein TsaB [hydrothermal vent metagenome]|uniref:tRNA threonylcarbamoyladenosine biosynthesis protein TsaB n=1 Tax=hydrothermal vent metagenome TaxID=652676 RepID=A0A3B0YZN0_9ZZZZ
MKILAIETATEACTVALRYDNEVLERYEIKPRGHSLLVLPMIEELLSEAGLSKSALDVIAFGCGPGAFTGVRIAASITQGIAFAMDIPVVPVSTLLGLAQGAFRQFGVCQIIPIIDARMDEVYLSQCTLGQEGIMQPLMSELVISPNEVDLPNTGSWLGVGSGWDRYHDILLSDSSLTVTWNPGLLPHAQDVAEIGQSLFEQGRAVAAEEAIPVYVRNKVAAKTHERKIDS